MPNCINHVLNCGIILGDTFELVDTSKPHLIR